MVMLVAKHPLISNRTHWYASKWLAAITGRKWTFSLGSRLQELIADHVADLGGEVLWIRVRPVFVRAPGRNHG